MAEIKENIVENVSVMNEARYLMSVNESLNNIMILSKDADTMTDIKRTIHAVVDSLTAKDPTIRDIVKFVEKSNEDKVNVPCEICE